VEAALRHLDALPAWRQARVADVGTGSGAIAVAIARSRPRAVVHATDTSYAALRIAAANVKRHVSGSRVALHHGDLLAPLSTRLDLIVANLPYVASAEIASLAREVRDHEPRVALESGPSGLEVIARLLRQAPAYLSTGGAVCLEFGYGQAGAIEALARQTFEDAGVRVIPDLTGTPRVITITTPARP
jgi:release factor glutamine methyltransferase